MNQARALTTTNSQLKEGYKQTEVGVIPEDWEVKPLAGSISIIHGYGFESQFFSSHGAFFLTTPGNFHEDGGFRDLGEKQKFYNGFLPEGFLLSHEDLIVAMTEQAEGLLGSAAFIPTEGKYLHNQRLGKIKVTSANISTRFLYWVFNSKAYRRKVNETAAGTKVKHTSPSKLLEIPVLLPSSKSEQEAIACTLSDIDALIESLDRLLTKKRQIKQGAMQELLRSKEGWIVKRLGEICEIGMGRTPPRLNGSFWGKGYKWLSIADLKYKVVSESKEEITALAAAEMKIIPKGTLLMSFKLSLGRLCFAGCDLFTNEAICSFNQPQANTEFLYYVLGRTDFSLYGKQAVKGYTLNKESLNLIEVNLPSIAEQIEIANILSDMDGEIDSIESKLAKTRQLKQGMMHELLTGRIRLVNAKL
jgi:type I restriction enzyme, S subunit